jgi:hypothetical protein
VFTAQRSLAAHQSLGLVQQGSLLCLTCCLTAALLQWYLSTGLHSMQFVLDVQWPAWLGPLQLDSESTTLNLGTQSSHHDTAYHMLCVSVVCHHTDSVHARLLLTPTKPWLKSDEHLHPRTHTPHPRAHTPHPRTHTPHPRTHTPHPRTHTPHPTPSHSPHTRAPHTHISSHFHLVPMMPQLTAG